MCDYSLHVHPNRLANEGETLAVTRFPGGSKGFACPAELEARRSLEEPRPRFEWSWEGFKNYWRSLRTVDRNAAPPLTAVCIPPGAKLLIDNMPKTLQDSLAVSETERVTFMQLGCEGYAYRDAVRFPNGREILIQRLAENQRATVISLGGREDIFEMGYAPRHALQLTLD